VERRSYIIAGRPLYRRAGSAEKSGKHREEQEAPRRAGSTEKSGKRREEREAPRRAGSAEKSGKRRASTKDEEAARKEEWKEGLI
jgi:hypothetical protein